MPSPSFPKVIALVWTIVLGLSCLLPSSAFEAFKLEQLFSFDKALHFTAFALLALFWLHFLSDIKALTRLHIVALLTIVCAYGLLIEFLQSSMHLGRHFEWADVLADTIGAFFGVLLIKPYRRLYPLLQKYLPFVS